VRYCSARDNKQGVANRLYGKTKGRVVGETPTTGATLPPRQPDRLALDLVADHVSQRARSQFVRGEDVTFFADGTNLTVADPISGIPPHGGVMLLDFVGQICDVRHQFETLGSEVL